MTSIASLDDLIALGRSRWAAPLLADLAAHRGARFAELLHRLDLPRDSLSRTLSATMALGWVAPHRGHGHPLRPEYVLTAEGARLAKIAGAIVSAQRRLGISPALLSRWSLPIVRTIAQGDVRFNAMVRALAPATPRALSQGLRGLADSQLIVREVIDDYPPVSHYGLTRNGRLLSLAFPGR